MASYEREQHCVIQAACQAALLTRRVHQRLVVAAEKGEGEPVTIADFGSQALLCRALSKNFPSDAVVAEERASDFLEKVSPDQQEAIVQFLEDTLEEPVSQETLCTWLEQGRNHTASRTWVIDPIDGTKGFLAGRHYTIAIALLEGGHPVFSILACPKYPRLGMQGILFSAVAGEGAFCWPLPDAGGSCGKYDDADAVAVSVSQQSLAAQVRGLESVEERHTNHAALERVRVEAGFSSEQVVRMDGQDKYAAIAAGDAEYYLRLSPRADYREKIWDHAAGWLIVQEAGGMVTDLHGKPLDFSAGSRLEHNYGIIASNGPIHDAIVAAIRSTV